jgi:aminodeoxyfutalosine deaminase
MEPATVMALARKYGEALDESTVAARYATRDFTTFIEAYKWVTSYLRAPGDYALAAGRMCEQMLAQNIVYAEVTLSAGVMLLRKQNIEANFYAIREAVVPYESRGLRLQWILDAVRQFGAAAARDVVRAAAGLRDAGVIAFGMGGAETAAPAAEFREAYDYAAANRLHRLVHAGEVGGPDSVRDAVEILDAERIGHGIAAAADPKLMALLAERSVGLEICPTSNVRTDALALFLGRADSRLNDHPLPQLFRAGIPVSVSTDDPAMFDTDLSREFRTLSDMGLRKKEIISIAEGGFSGAFLPSAEKSALLQAFRGRAAALALL